MIDLSSVWVELFSIVEQGKLDHKELDFVEKMRIQVMRNLVLTIHNLHIRYEMNSSAKLGHPFSFGLTFHYLEIAVLFDDIFSLCFHHSKAPSFRQQTMSRKLTT